MVKIRACGAVAVLEVVVEGVGLLATCVVVQDDAWAGGGGLALMCLHQLGLKLFELRDNAIARYVKSVSKLVVLRRHHYRLPEYPYRPGQRMTACCDWDFELPVQLGVILYSRF